MWVRPWVRRSLEESLSLSSSYGGNLGQEDLEWAPVSRSQSQALSWATYTLYVNIGHYMSSWFPSLQRLCRSSIIFCDSAILISGFRFIAGSYKQWGEYFILYGNITQNKTNAEGRYFNWWISIKNSSWPEEEPMGCACRRKAEAGDEVCAPLPEALWTGPLGQDIDTTVLVKSQWVANPTKVS